MEGRKWEDMEIDCLVNIFGRVGIESLALDVPFVCKSWYKATLNPLCWQSLIFPKDLEDSRFPWSIDPEGLLKGAVNRSQRSATRLALPDDCSIKDLIYVSEECPLLKLLKLPSSVIYNHEDFIIPSMINKLKNLETLMLQFSLDLEEIIAQISLHCKNFIELSVTNAKISSDEAIAIATLLPNIKGLDLRRCKLERSDLVIILNGCKKLEHMDVCNCIGFESDDEEILNLASHITTFKCEGSCLYDIDAAIDDFDYDYFDDYDDGSGLCSRDVDFHYGSD
ncbi:hypothetical protein LguiA_001788 [Lonicera macranthoides]